MIRVLIGDCRDWLPRLKEESVHCVVTSPPYWNLRAYNAPDTDWDDGWRGQLGLEPQPELYIQHLTSIFEQAKRVLHPSGVMFVNVGDSFAGAGDRRQTGNAKGNEHNQQKKHKTPDAEINLKPKDLIGIPFMLFFALRDAGWWTRQTIIWAKGVSGQQFTIDLVHNAAMELDFPLSIRTQIADALVEKLAIFHGNSMPESTKDRPVSSHEYVFLLTKSARYHYDWIASREPAVGGHSSASFKRENSKRGELVIPGQSSATHRQEREDIDYNGPSRNSRSVWCINTKGFRGAHFAVMSPELAEKCIESAVGKKGCCPVCGAPWERVVERSEGPNQEWAQDTNPTEKEAALIATGKRCGHGKLNRGSKEDYYLNAARNTTVGWQPTCDCEETFDTGGVTQWDTFIEDSRTPDPIPCTILDPFGGSGTTAIEAAKQGHDAIIIEISAEYVDLAVKRIRDELGDEITISVEEL